MPGWSPGPGCGPLDTRRSSPLSCRRSNTESWTGLSWRVGWHWMNLLSLKNFQTAQCLPVNKWIRYENCVHKKTCASPSLGKNLIAYPWMSQGQENQTAAIGPKSSLSHKPYPRSWLYGYWSSSIKQNTYQRIQLGAPSNIKVHVMKIIPRIHYALLLRPCVCIFCFWFYVKLTRVPLNI